MLRRRITVSISLFESNFNRQFFRRHLRSKANHGYDDVSRRNISSHEEEKAEGKIHLLKSRGQHLLTNPRILDSIVRNSNIKSDDTVLEIGPGTGNLTFKLLEAASKVVAIEIDKRMIEILHKRAAERGVQDRLDIIYGDALKIDFPDFNLVVANIPYGISSPLLAKLVFGIKSNPYRSATLLLQKEFARRLLAKPGDSEFNRLAVNISMFAELELIMDVSKRDFVPPPKVDSSVVKIYPKTKIPDVNLEEWWAFTRTCFSKKNKTLGATFKQKRKLMELMKLSKFEGLSVDSDDDDDLGSGSDISFLRGEIVGVLESGGFSDKRPSKMSNDDLLQLLSLLNEAGIYFRDRAKGKDSFDAVFAVCDDML